MWCNSVSCDRGRVTSVERRQSRRVQRRELRRRSRLKKRTRLVGKKSTRFVRLSGRVLKLGRLAARRLYRLESKTLVQRECDGQGQSLDCFIRIHYNFATYGAPGLRKCSLYYTSVKFPHTLNITFLKGLEVHTNYNNNFLSPTRRLLSAVPKTAS